MNNYSNEIDKLENEIRELKSIATSGKLSYPAIKAVVLQEDELSKKVIELYRKWNNDILEEMR